MSEIMRFRMARAPQRAAAKASNQLKLWGAKTIEEWSKSANASDVVFFFLRDQGMIRAQGGGYGRLSDTFTCEPAIRQMLEAVRKLDQLLLADANEVGWDRVTPEFQKIFDGDGPAVVQRPEWIRLRDVLSLTLVALVLLKGGAAIAADVIRLLLIMGLVETPAGEAPHDAKAVYHALRWRTILLPSWLTTLPYLHKSVLARRPGFSDLYTVRQEWKRYEPGEIAHIENVLKGEIKRSLFEMTDEQELTLTVDTASMKQATQDTQTTDRFELKSSSQSNISQALHLEGKVDTSGQYGPTKIDTHLGGTFD
jgi:hypothetical protein